MVVVTGNVVTDQPGQLNADVISEIVKEAYDMIQDVFSDQFVFPVIGSLDTFPARYFPFMDRDSFDFWKPAQSKKNQYISESTRTFANIQAEWTAKYPFNGEHRTITDLNFNAQNNITDYGYYKVENVPYKIVS